MEQRPAGASVAAADEAQLADLAHQREADEGTGGAPGGQRRRGRGLVGDLGEEPQEHLADLQLRAGRQRDPALAARAIDERTVAAAEIADGPLVVGDLELRVLARHRRRQEHQLAILLAADAGLRPHGVREAEAIDDPRHRIIGIDGGANVIGDQPLARRDVPRARPTQHADLGCTATTETHPHGPIEPRAARADKMRG